MPRWRPTRWTGHASATPAAACLIAFGSGLGVAAIAKPAILPDRYGDHGCPPITNILGTHTTIPVGHLQAAGHALVRLRV